MLYKSQLVSLQNSVPSFLRCVVYVFFIVCVYILFYVLDFKLACKIIDEIEKRAQLKRKLCIGLT